MALRPFQKVEPMVDPSAFVEPSAQVVGAVTIGARSSVWFNVVIRGDVNAVRIGSETNVQDLCCLHVTAKHPLTLGDRVTVGHGVMLHGCTLEDDTLIGIGAIVLDGAHVEKGSVIAAGAVVTPGTRVPAGSLALGSPARVKRPVTPEEREWIAASATNYVRYSRQHRGGA